MPAPQASAMKQLARLKFTSFSLKVPTNWRDPSGGTAADHYGKAFKQNEKASSPGMPPLFQPASLNKYHTDTQKMHIAKIGKFIDDTCTAICSAWSTWQSAATMVGVVINAVTAVVHRCLLVARVLGLLAGLAFWLTGVPYSALWSVVTAFAALIPWAEPRS